MTKRKLSALIDKIHEDIGDVHVKTPMAIFPPTVEILKGLYFELSGSDASRFFVWTFFMPLCVPSKHVTLNLGRRIGGTEQRWDFNDAILHEKLHVVIRAEAIPFLKQAQTPFLASRLAMSLHSSDKSPFPLQANAYLLARSGEITEAIKSLETLLSSLSTDAPWQLEMASRADYLKSLLIRNPDQATRQLREWELETKRNLKIDQLVA